MGEEFKIQYCDETITKIIDVKHAFLIELATQYGVKRWAEEVIALTSNIDQSLKRL